MLSHAAGFRLALGLALPLALIDNLDCLSCRNRFSAACRIVARFSGAFPAHNPGFLFLARSTIYDAIALLRFNPGLTP